MGAQGARHASRPSWLARSELTIFMYHGVVRDPLPVPDWCFVTEDRFERQLRHIRRHFDVRPLDDALQRLQRGQLQKPTAAVTFDDGLSSVHDLALPLLEHYRVPATVFLVTELVGGCQTLWWCELVQAVGTTTALSVQWRQREVPLTTALERRAFLRAVQVELKELPHEALLEHVRQLVTQLRPSPAPAVAFPVLDRPAVAQLADHDLVDLGAHTCTHPILTRVPRQRAQHEIERSVAATEELSGRPCRLFAYPNGGPGDLDDGVVEMVAKSGVRGAVTTVPGSNGPGSDPLRLRRIGIGAPDTVLSTWLKVHAGPAARAVRDRHLRRRAAP